MKLIALLTIPLVVLEAKNRIERDTSNLENQFPVSIKAEKAECEPFTTGNNDPNLFNIMFNKTNI